MTFLRDVATSNFAFDLEAGAFDRSDLIPSPPNERYYWIMTLHSLMFVESSRTTGSGFFFAGFDAFFLAEGIHGPRVFMVQNKGTILFSFPVKHNAADQWKVHPGAAQSIYLPMTVSFGAARTFMLHHLGDHYWKVTLLTVISQARISKLGKNDKKAFLQVPTGPGRNSYPWQGCILRPQAKHRDPWHNGAKGAVPKLSCVN